MKPLYPHITVQLTGKNGNAFHILGSVKQGLQKGNVPRGKIEQFMEEATQGNYDNLLAICMKWVEVA